MLHGTVWWMKVARVVVHGGFSGFIEIIRGILLGIVVKVTVGLEFNNLILHLSSIKYICIHLNTLIGWIKM